MYISVKEVIDICRRRVGRRRGRIRRGRIERGRSQRKRKKKKTKKTKKTKKMKKKKTNKITRPYTLGWLLNQFNFFKSPESYYVSHFA